MTREEFEKIFDVWYKRTHKLRRMHQDKSNSPEKRIKAFRLWLIMYTRVIKMFNIYKERTIVTLSHESNTGCIVNSDNNQEPIVNSKGRKYIT